MRFPSLKESTSKFISPEFTSKVPACVRDAISDKKISQFIRYGCFLVGKMQVGIIFFPLTLQVVDFLTRKQFANLKESTVISFQDLMDQKALIFGQGNFWLIAS